MLKHNFIHSDHLGTPKAITNDKQETVWSIEMDTFGEVKDIKAKNNFIFNLRFAGQYHDHETGYYYNYHRYYNPETGRYLTSDPIGLAGGLNTYGYVDGKPWEGVDVLGLDVIVIHNGKTKDNPFGHTAIAVEGYGLYSFGNAGDLKGEFSVNNNIMGGDYDVLLAYTRREATRRDTRITLIETTAEQDQKIVDILNQKTSKSGYLDNCASRTAQALDQLYPYVDLPNRITIARNATLPIDVEITAKQYMNYFGGKIYYIDKVNSTFDAEKLILKNDFKKFDNVIR